MDASLYTVLMVFKYEFYVTINPIKDYIVVRS